MAAFKVKLVIYQGDTFTQRFVWKTGTTAESTPVDLTGCTARMQIRPSVASTDVILELTTENDRIVLGDAAGTIDLAIAFEDTTVLDFTTGVYDLEIVRPDGTVRRLIRGHVRLSDEVTRDE